MSKKPTTPKTKRRTIVFQGEPGANSHIACKEAYPDHEPVPCPTFEDAFTAVANGEADLGMIPIENSVAGRVSDIHHLMPTAGLHIVAENIEDESHSTTRFIVLSREDKRARSGDGQVLTTFVFQVRNIPAALYKALGGFATNRVNMTKLESYMIEGNFFATQFYADVDGHPDDPNLKLALEELKFFSKELIILGVYPAHEFRKSMGKS